MGAILTQLSYIMTREITHQQTVNMVILQNKYQWSLSDDAKRSYVLTQHKPTHIFIKGDCRGKLQQMKKMETPDFHKVNFGIWFEAFPMEIPERSRYHWNRHVLKYGCRCLNHRNPSIQTWNIPKNRKKKLHFTRENGVTSATFEVAQYWRYFSVTCVIVVTWQRHIDTVLNLTTSSSCNNI